MRARRRAARDLQVYGRLPVQKPVFAEQAEVDLMQLVHGGAGREAQLPQAALETPRVAVPFKEPSLHGSGDFIDAVAEEKAPIVDGELMLGVWQRIFVCELDRSRPRKIFIQVVGE